MSIIVDRISKKFGNFQALEQVSLEVEKGKLVALLGPSGSGKSTLLRALAGLEKPDTGTIVIDGRDTTHLKIQQRNIGFVFQHYALFKHLTVRQNIAFGLQIRKYSKTVIKHRVEELLALIQLEGLGDRYPSQLSGGQRQRVGLARSLAIQPQVLLLDEPFGALDAKVRKELRTWLRGFHEDVRVTSIFVTHDQEEAMAVADKIVIMNLGRIEQIGTPAEVYEHPATPFVMSFVGEVNVLPTTAPLFCELKERPSHLRAFIRPHDIEIKTSSDRNTTPARVQRIIHLGREIQLELMLPDNLRITAHLEREQFAKLDLQTGQEIFIKPKATKIFNSQLSR